MFLHRWKMSLNQDVSRCRLFFLPFYQLLFSFLFHVHIEFLYFYFFCLFTLIWRLKVLVSLVDLYLISEKSIWKNQVRRTGFLVYFELDFYCLCSLQKSISKLIFGGQNSSLSNLIFTTWYFKNQVQINRGFGLCRHRKLEKLLSNFKTIYLVKQVSSHS